MVLDQIHNMELRAQIGSGMTDVEGKLVYAYDTVVGHIKSYDPITGIATMKIDDVNSEAFKELYKNMLV